MSRMIETKRVEDIFHVHGYFEELGVKIGDSFKSLGTREIPNPQPSRSLGVNGTRDYVITSPVVLTKGHKTVTIRASVNKPLVCFGVAQALCGRAK